MQTVGDERIEELLARDGFNFECEECVYHLKYREQHPYGDTVAYETFHECTCDNYKNCPRLNVGLN